MEGAPGYPQNTAWGQTGEEISMNVPSQNGRKRIVFQLSAEPGSHVSVCGTFNRWNPEQFPMKDNPKNGLFKTMLLLPKGRHEYKFVVNGEWRTDPDGQEQASNECGSMNSVIVV
jgi:1,4-alpha-glucan branching enzyme